jgi:anti-sigma B factor antagonist
VVRQSYPDPVTDQPAASLVRDAKTITVALHGEVDVLNVDQVRMALTEAIGAGPAQIVVDLDDLSFIDSTGLGALVFGFQRARDAGIGFRLTRPTRGVRHVLVLSGLLEVVELVTPAQPPPTQA